MPPFRITAISYLNTLPFIYGIKNSGFLTDYVLSLEVPSVSAEKLATKNADAGLIPVAALPRIAPWRLQGDFCLAAEGRVKSVLLLSNRPLDKIAKISLDPDSRSSVALVKVLSKFFWKIKPEWQDVNRDKKDRMRLLDSVVVIGDKAFELESYFEYVYDLSAEWYRHTGLPFVFAVWASARKLPGEQEEQLHAALEYGVQSIKEAVETAPDEWKRKVDILDYLTNCIHFRLDEEKKKGMNLFLDYIKRI